MITANSAHTRAGSTIETGFVRSWTAGGAQINRLFLSDRHRVAPCWRQVPGTDCRVLTQAPAHGSLPHPTTTPKAPGPKQVAGHLSALVVQQASQAVFHRPRGTGLPLGPSRRATLPPTPITAPLSPSPWPASLRPSTLHLTTCGCIFGYAGRQEAPY